MKPKELKIDRSRWRFGDHHIDLPFDGRENFGPFKGITALLNRHGEMCCLGFYAEACGIGKKSLLGVGMPLSIQYKDRGRLLQKIGDVDIWAEDAIYINDGRYSSLKERERAIIKLFKENSVKVKFIGRYPKAVKDFFDNRRYPKAVKDFFDND